MKKTKLNMMHPTVRNWVGDAHVVSFKYRDGGWTLFVVTRAIAFAGVPIYRLTRFFKINEEVHASVDVDNMAADEFIPKMLEALA